MSNTTSSDGFFRRHLATLVTVAVVIVALVALFAFFIGFWADADARLMRWFIQNVWIGLLFPNGWNLLMVGPIAMAIGATIFFLLRWFLQPDTQSFGYGYTHDERKRIMAERDAAIAKRRGVRTTALVLAVVSLVYMLVATGVNIPAKGASYNYATTLVVDDITKLPPTLANLGGTHRSSDPNCDLIATNNGNRACIKQGNMDTEWVNRNVSVEGAKTVIGRNAASDNNADMMEETLSLVRKGSASVWTGVIDGKNAVPIKGIAEWSGAYGEQPNLCTFSGSHDLRKAFNGQWGTNLADDIAAHYPGMLYDSSDIWGYCKGSDYATAEPVLVVPMTKQVGTGRSYLTTLRFAGLLTIQGSSTGDPKYSFDAAPKTEDYPGPIYPASLAAHQRAALDMQGGLLTNWFKGFGYQPMTIDTNAANPSEYQLVSAKDGRNYWVTPMSARGSKSQNVIAYTVIPADVAMVGQLNPMTTYVLNGDVHDSRIANLQTMVQNVTSALNREEPNFTGSGGSIKEFLPVKDDLWQVYAERGGLVKYKIEVHTDGKVAAVIPLERADTQPVAGSVACGKPVTGMSNAELAACIKAAADEAEHRMK